MSSALNNSNNTNIDNKSLKNFPLDHFICVLCQGYIIDATTLSDCLHPCKKKKICV